MKKNFILLLSFCCIVSLQAMEQNNSQKTVSDQNPLVKNSKPATKQPDREQNMFVMSLFASLASDEDLALYIKQLNKSSVPNIQQN